MVLTVPRPAVKMSGVNSAVSFVTDYGWAGGFVGMLHAVVDQVSDGEVAVIDVDHCIPAHDVLLGALRMERSCRYLRAGVHVGVVDPGVGSSRRSVAIEAGGRLFVGPDNGLLMFAVDSVGGAGRVVSLEAESWLLPGRSRTFDGRDVFAPAATHLALGRDLADAGPAVDASSLVRIERPDDLMVLQVDGFGNVQLAGVVDASAGDEVTVAHGSLSVRAVVGETFADVRIGGAVLLTDSDGCLALSVNQGRADELLGLAPGDRVELA